MASGPITSWQMEEGKVEAVTDFIFLGSKITADSDRSCEIKRCLLLAVQGTLKSLLQHHGTKTSVLQCAAFLMIHLSHLCMTAGKTIALTIWTFVGKVLSLLFNMLPNVFVIVFLPRSKYLLISCLQSLSAVILEPKKRKSVTASTFAASICHEVMGLDATILVFKY